MSTQDNAVNNVQIENSNKWSTRQLVVMALMAAIGAALSFLEFAIFPAAPYLKYDPSMICAMVMGFAYGAGPGFAVAVVIAVIHGLIMADFWGSVMTIIVSVGFVIPAALIYRRHRTMKGAIAGLVVSFVAAIVLAIIGNILVTPLYSGVSVDVVVQMIVPILLPFNIMKALLNSILTLIVYKSISNLITPKKKQVKGR